MHEPGMQLFVPWILASMWHILAGMLPLLFCVEAKGISKLPSAVR